MLIFVHDSVHEYATDMAKASSIGRARGSIRQRGRSYQVRVYAGEDPVTGKPNYLTGSASNNKDAERILRRLVTAVDEQRNARTKATFGMALDAWLRVHDAAENTLAGYESNVRLYIKPALGDVPIGKITAHMLEELYAQLRRCRARCNRRPFVEHRIDGPHECRVVQHRRPPGRPPAGGYPPHACAAMRCRVMECRPHECQPLSAAMIRQIHITIRGALSAAVRWEWITSNPASVARKPRQPEPQPDPPSPEEAARIIAAAWVHDEDWGTFVWLAMVTGMRRAELLGLRWSRVNFDAGMLEIRTNYVWVQGRGVDKDTKTHRMRRIALDQNTIEVLRAHHKRYESLCASIGTEPTATAYLFSHEPSRDRPYNPDGVSHRYTQMCAELGIASHLHALRHYSATELLTAGVDLRTVGGRLGHAGGGSTTLRVYAAWVGASDRKAAEILGGRMTRPRRPAETS
jgi:integrase